MRRHSQLSDGSYRLVSKAAKLALTALAKVKPGNGLPLTRILTPGTDCGESQRDSGPKPSNSVGFVNGF